MSSFWESLDQNEFSLQLQKRLEKELTEGFGSLIDHLNPKEKYKFALQRLEKKSIEFMKTQLEILKSMCEKGVFIEPTDVPKRRPTGYKGNEAELDAEINKLIKRVAKAKGELKSLEEREVVLLASSSIVESNVGKIKDIVEQTDFVKLSETSRESKRLRYLVQCTKELKDKLPLIHDGGNSLETALTRERRGMPSTRGLAALDTLLSKVPDE
jgi:hypothetical protein